MITVTGATGTIGTELLRLLSAAESPVRALSRDPPSGDASPDIAWVRADLADRDGLPAALAGSHRLFLLTGNAANMVALQKNAIEAARRAGVAHVVKVSALGATDHSKSVIGLWHYNVERILRDSGMGWTILRPHHFMQNLLDDLVFDREAGQIRSASGEGRIPFVDTRDIAAVAAEILERDGHAGEILTLTGPEAVSYREATEIIAEILGRSVSYASETIDEAWARRRAAGQPAWLAAAQIAIAEYQRAGGPTERVTDTVQRVTGRPARTLRQFAQAHRETLAMAGPDRTPPSTG